MINAFKEFKTADIFKIDSEDVKLNAIDLEYDSKSLDHNEESIRTQPNEETSIFKHERPARMEERRPSWSVKSLMVSNGVSATHKRLRFHTNKIVKRNKHNNEANEEHRFLPVIKSGETFKKEEVLNPASTTNDVDGRADEGIDHLHNLIDAPSTLFSVITFKRGESQAHRNLETFLSDAEMCSHGSACLTEDGCNGTCDLQSLECFSFTSTHCNECGKRLLEIELKTSDRPSDTSWNLKEVEYDELVWSQGSYDDKRTACILMMSDANSSYPQLEVFLTW